MAKTRHKPVPARAPNPEGKLVWTKGNQAARGAGRPKGSRAIAPKRVVEKILSDWEALDQNTAKYPNGVFAWLLEERPELAIKLIEKLLPKHIDVEHSGQAAAQLIQIVTNVPRPGLDAKPIESTVVALPTLPTPEVADVIDQEIIEIVDGDDDDDESG